MGLRDEKIGFIGAGNMATALVKGLMESGLYGSNQIMASDIKEEHIRKLSGQFGIEVGLSNRELVKQCAIIVLSVKPQSMTEVLEDIKGEVKEDHLFISIAAGIPLKMIEDRLGRAIPLIRVMPNTPALIQKGISALASGNLTTQEQMDVARGIFDAVGKTVIVREEMMDAVTAISGSGPGYVFMIMESFVQAGEQLGFDGDTALRLILQTFLGAAHLAVESDKSLSQLRDMVTSPGGTTAAGLEVFERRGLNEIIREGVGAAHDRGVELGKKG